MTSAVRGVLGAVSFGALLLAALGEWGSSSRGKQDRAGPPGLVRGNSAGPSGGRPRPLESEHDEQGPDAGPTEQTPEEGLFQLPAAVEVLVDDREAREPLTDDPDVAVFEPGPVQLPAEEGAQPRGPDWVPEQEEALPAPD